MIVAAAVVFFSLSTALVISLLALRRANRDRTAAEQANKMSADALASVTDMEIGHTEAVIRNGYQRLLSAYGPDNRQTIAVGDYLGWEMVQEHHFDDAEPLLRDTLGRARSVLGPSDRTTILCIVHMIGCCNEMQRHDQAVAYTRELFYAVKASELDPKQVADMSDWWGGKLTQIQRYAEARQPLLDALELMNARGMSQHPKAKKVMLMLATGCDALGDRAEAAEWRRRAEALNLPPW